VDSLEVFKEFPSIVFAPVERRDDAPARGCASVRTFLKRVFSHFINLWRIDALIGKLLIGN
jgi:hypothetical protein